MIDTQIRWGFPDGTVVRNPPAKVRDTRDAALIPESGRSSGVGNGNPLGILTWKIPWTEKPCGPQSMEVTKSCL